MVPIARFRQTVNPRSLPQKQRPLCDAGVAISVRSAVRYLTPVSVVQLSDLTGTLGSPKSRGVCGTMRRAARATGDKEILE